MSELIKSGQAALALVRPLPLNTSAPGRLALRSEDERLRERISVLEAELKARDAAIERLRGEAQEAIASARRKGHAQGLADAKSADDKRLALLERVLADAGKALKADLSALARLAPLLASDALEIVFGDPDYRKSQIAEIIAQQLSRIEPATLVAVSVSAEDFPNPEALSELANRAGVAAIHCSPSVELPSGGCTMQLKLGVHEVGIDRQWGTLRDVLAEIALPGVAP